MTCLAAVVLSRTGVVGRASMLGGVQIMCPGLLSCTGGVAARAAVARPLLTNDVRRPCVAGEVRRSAGSRSHGGSVRRRATTVLLMPLPQSSTIPARSARACADLRRRINELEPILARHGIGIDRAVLSDKSRTLARSLGELRGSRASDLGRALYQLDQTLDQLGAVLKSRPRPARRVRAEALQPQPEQH